MSDLSNQALQIAQTQVGKEEIPKGSNWGPVVSEYLRSVGINFPASWCMAFVYWCYDKAAHNLGIENPLKKTGGVLAQWNAMPNNKINFPPKVGDIFIMDLGHGLGHTGIVEAVNEDGTLTTIEGNTNDTGSREGFEVAKKIRRNDKPIIGYIRV